MLKLNHAVHYSGKWHYRICLSFNLLYDWTTLHRIWSSFYFKRLHKGYYGETRHFSLFFQTCLSCVHDFNSPFTILIIARSWSISMIKGPGWSWKKILGNGSIMWSEEQNGSCLVVETVKISNASFNFLSGLCKAVTSRFLWVIWKPCRGN